METHSDLRQNGSVIRYDSELLDRMEPLLFDAEWLKAEGHYHGGSAGRSEAHFFSFAGREMVLRHFRRGGLVGRINRDLYFRTGLDRSRSIREFGLLHWMHGNALPVPRPVAALVSNAGIFYRAAIITERIPGARPLQEILQNDSLPAHVWSDVGAVIRQMHEACVYHSDLNCRNILIDVQERVWLIDFDKGDRRNPGAWMQGNLDRLLRSLRKSATLHPELCWHQGDWSHLLAGYTTGTKAA